MNGITHNTGSDTPDDTNSSNAATWTDGSDDHLGMTPDKVTGGTDTIAPIASPSATANGYNITTGEVSGVTTANVTSASETTAVTKNAAAAAGDAYTFTYGIGVAPGTTAGTYRT